MGSGGGDRIEVCTIFDFIKAVALVTVRREDSDSVAELLQPDGSINNKPLRTTNAQVGVDEPDVEDLIPSGRHCVLWWGRT